MTTRNRHAIVVELKGSDDYRTIVAVLDEAGLRATDEIWEQWQPFQKRRITFTFGTKDEADLATGALSAFLAR